MKLEAIFLCPTACYLGEETSPHLSAASFQILIERNRVPLRPS